MSVFNPEGKSTDSIVIRAKVQIPALPLTSKHWAQDNFAEFQTTYMENEFRQWLVLVNEYVG